MAYKNLTYDEYQAEVKRLMQYGDAVEPEVHDGYEHGTEPITIAGFFDQILKYGAG